MSEEHTGSFFARAYTASGAWPLEGVSVAVRKSGGYEGAGELITVLYTNADGITPTIKLPSPAPSESFSPDDTASYTYTAEAMKPGYYTVGSLSLPIYPDRTTVLPINMLPLPETGGYTGYPYGSSATYNDR
ncbi:MAG: hypothetical protein J5940_04680 [Clostridia bacterium]|nr:hypothetical protein [Clostridia bacterium]